MTTLAPQVKSEMMELASRPEDHLMPDVKQEGAVLGFRGGELAKKEHAVESQAPPIDPLKLLQINSARLAHANTLSLMINNTSQVYSQRVSAGFLETLKAQQNDPSVANALDCLDTYNNEVLELFKTGQVEAVGMMKGITDGTMRVLYQVYKANPQLEVSEIKETLEAKILTDGWAKIIKRIPDDLEKACSLFLKAEGLKAFLDVRSYNNGELVPWIDGDTDSMTRDAEEQAAYDANTQTYLVDQQAAIENFASNMAPAGFPMQDPTMGMPMAFPQPVNNRYMPYPRVTMRNGRRKKNYSARYYTPKNKQKNPNSRRLCRAIWQDDGKTRGCKQNSHPRGVCACWKRRGFTKKDLKNGRIIAWLNMAFPGKKFTM